MTRPAFTEDSVQERVSLAVESLAVSAEPIQRRLFWAGMQLLPLLPDDFRELEDRARFASIVNSLKEANASTHEAELIANIYSMEDGDAVAVARQIVELDESL